MQTMMWVRMVKGHRILKQSTIPCVHSEPLEPLLEACHQLDLPRPLWLNKNQKEWDDFNQTRFTQEHFLESISFDKLEIEYINPQAQKQKSQDPRNAV